MQEHWLNDFEKNTIGNLVPNYTAFVRCWDSNEKVTNFKARRGKGGVVIMWPTSWSHGIKRLDDGNERIIGIEVKDRTKSVYIFNVYMPTNETNSMENFNKHLDILHTLLLKYSKLGTVIICGDMNGTLISDRNNGHDKSLKNFVSEHNLSWQQEAMGNKSTFVSHTGRGQSQIDYILCLEPEILALTEVEDKHFLNQSAHTSVSSWLNIQKPSGNLNSKSENVGSKTVLKMNWNKVDKFKFQSILNEQLSILQGDHSLDPGESLKYIGMCLNEAALNSVPCRTLKLNGPCFKASPTVRTLLRECKSAHVMWKGQGSPGPGSESFAKRKDTKKELRSQLRKENYQRKENFF